ncbi:MAG: carboxypeptidase-like regulatory domain-containing protein, partial [Planctomycetota bacterium]
MTRPSTSDRWSLPLIALGLVAALVAGAFWLLGGSGSDTSDSSPVVATATTEATNSSQPPADGLRRTDSPTGAQRAVSPAREAAAEAPTNGLVATPDEASPATPSRVVGRVAAEGGPALGAAEVEFALGRGPLRSERTSGVADADGGFVLEVPGDRAGRLSVGAPGFVTVDFDDLSVPPGSTHDLGEVRLARAARLEGRVVDDLGRGVPDAELRLVENDRDPFEQGFLLAQAPLARSDRDGRFVVDRAPIGPWSLRVDSPAHPPALFEGQTSAGERQSLGLRFELSPGGRILGSVRGLPNGVAEGIQVAAYRAERTDVPERRFAPVSADGRFELDGLAPEAPYRLQLRTATETSWFGGLAGDSLSEPVVARTGDTGVVLDFRAASRLSMAVVDAETGAPVEEFVLRVEQLYRLERLRGPVPGRPNFFPGGMVDAVEVRLEDPDGDASLSIEAVGYAVASLEARGLQPGERRDLGRVELEPIPTLAVRVVDERSGQPVPDAKVQLMPERAPAASTTISFGVSVEVDASTGEETVDYGDGRRTARTDADGVARFSVFDVERLDLLVRADDYAELSLSGLELSPDEPLEVELGLGGSLEVLVVDASGAPVAGAPIEHRVGDGSSPPRVDFEAFALGGDGSPRSDADGRVRFPRLAPGPHQVRLPKPRSGGTIVISGATLGAGDGDEWTDVEVIAGERVEVVLVAPETTTLSGQI